MTVGMLLPHVNAPWHVVSIYHPGELYLFGMLHQCALVDGAVLDAPRHAALKAWFRGVAADPRTARVLSGRSAMGPLHQYFQAIDSPDVCVLGDEREEEEAAPEA